jgi:hypothetical protein
MDWQNISQWMNKPEYVLGLSVAVVVLLFWNVILYRRWKQFNRRWHQLMQGTEGQSLETILHENLRRLAYMDETLKAQGNHLQHLQSQTDQCLQHVGLVRFDAFEDVGGQQSFSLAFMNVGRDGIVLSGIHSRNDIRVYAKSLDKGQSSVDLSDEEKQAIRQAVS